MCNPMHPLYGALPVPYVQLRVTLGAVVAHRYTSVVCTIMENFIAITDKSITKSRIAITDKL